jgi:hypothetical protein
MRIDAPYNLGNRDIVRGLQAALAAECAKDKDRWHRIKIRPARLTQHDKFRAYYFAVVVEAFYLFLREQDPGATKDDAHRRLKWECGLRVEEPDFRTGEIVTTGVRSITKISDEEFSDFVARARAWLDNDVGVPTPPPDPEYASKREAVTA